MKSLTSGNKRLESASAEIIIKIDTPTVVVVKSLFAAHFTIHTNAPMEDAVLFGREVERLYAFVFRVWVDYYAFDDPDLARQGEPAVILKDSVRWSVRYPAASGY